MKVRQFCEKYGVSKNRALGWIHAGKIQAWKPKGQWVVADDAVPPPTPEPEKPLEDIDLKEAFAKRCAYIRAMQKTAVTRDQKRRAYILRHEVDKTVPQIACYLGITNKEVMRIYDEELERMEGAIFS